MPTGALRGQAVEPGPARPKIKATLPNPRAECHVKCPSPVEARRRPIDERDGSAVHRRGTAGGGPECVPTTRLAGGPSTGARRRARTAGGEGPRHWRERGQEPLPDREASSGTTAGIPPSSAATDCADDCCCFDTPLTKTPKAAAIATRHSLQSTAADDDQHRRHVEIRI
ncbi:hypothetical protein IscW_ISCW000627 [Ixodes scapularis]|uniref:Uncharacterized protein n=1 Tax=Ixodes scapularis TaxID=6945 RepID=B7P7D6_IXOSC|nr:hypothetical protein IscW_ISCW000627 [Ixodes scapularis]|eukprot:XP_002410047.1 hypothetical protein IscW_ISCW000627 [Ixodes scapularis]